MVVESNASTSVDSAVDTGTTESIAIETSADSSITTEQKVTDPAADVPSAAEATFELFPKIPAELRIKIWKLVPAPRLAVVHFHTDRRKRTHKFAASIPAILHACQQSRHEALNIYHRAFDSKWALNGVYFNFKSDTLGFSCASLKTREFFLRKLKPQDLSRIERIALEFAEFGSVPRFVGLKELIYAAHLDYYHTHIISSCSTHDGSIHTLEELLESTSDEYSLCRYLKGTQLIFSRFKETFEGSEEASRISIRLGYLCMKGMPNEGNSFYFK